jgi:hypothetical protein
VEAAAAPSRWDVVCKQRERGGQRRGKLKNKETDEKNTKNEEFYLVKTSKSVTFAALNE